MKRVVATIFWMYKNKKLDFPYLRSALTVVGLVFMHILQVIILLEIPYRRIFPIELSTPAYERWVNTSLVLTPLLLLFLIFFKKIELENYPAQEDDIKKCRKIIPIYFFVSLLLLAALLIREGLRRGTL